MGKAPCLSILIATSTLPLLPLFIFFIYHKLHSPNNLMHSPSFLRSQLNSLTTHLTLAWSFISSIFSFESGVSENGEELNVIQYKCGIGSTEEAPECAICLSKVEEGEEIRELRCTHVFHKVCLDRWTGFRHMTCPLCRGKLASPRIASEAGEEAVQFKFCCLRSRRDRRDSWWIR